MLRSALALIFLALGAPQAMAQTLEQMAGQMIIVGFQGDDSGDPSVKALADEIGAVADGIVSGGAGGGHAAR